MSTDKTPLGETPAFPDDVRDGMTYRQWLAGLAMQGLLAQSNTVMISASRNEAEKLGELRVSETYAREAVECADALIAALEGK